jgi:peptidoglycan/LPS O-acetylase OafA/YrhL
MVTGFHFAPSIVRGGLLGVDVFFVLSGYLITALLMQEWDSTGSISLRNFYARRALRLLPALLVLLSLVFVFFPSFGYSYRPWKAVLAVLFYSANWVSAHQLLSLDVLAPTWSLAIEEQFYILWPPIVFLLLKFRVHRLWTLALVITGILSASVIRASLWHYSGPDIAPRLYYGLDTRMDSLLLGCLIALLAGWNLLPKKGWQLTAIKQAAAPAALLVLVIAVRPPLIALGYLYHGVEILFCVAVAVFLTAVLTSPPKYASLLLKQREIVWIGRLSYGLYLWQVPIFYGVLSPRHLAAAGLDDLTIRALQLLTLFAVASVSYYLIERPMLRLKDRFRRDRPTEEELCSAAVGPSALNLYKKTV